MANRSATILHGVAACGVTLVGRERRVGRDEVNGLGRDREFLGGDLNESRLDALPELALSGEDRDRAILVDANPRIEFRIALEAAGQLPFIRLLCHDQSRRQRETHDQRTPAEEKATS